jgi:hypothetical protein
VVRGSVGKRDQSGQAWVTQTQSPLIWVATARARVNLRHKAIEGGPRPGRSQRDIQRQERTRVIRGAATWFFFTLTAGARSAPRVISMEKLHLGHGQRAAPTRCPAGH